MSEKFQNKYRIESVRAAWWDYGWSGAYFITICTANRTPFFGEIKDNKMQLSPMGLLADVFWHEIKNHAENVELGAFVVMPNHVHGILILDKPEIVSSTESTTPVNVETRHALSLHHHQQSPAQQRFQNQGKNTVSSIIGSYKSAVTKHANRMGLKHEEESFGWQSRFHDHIIRNDNEYQRINDYIENNPANWNNDTFFSE
jgi:REP element-mobilizing transposase RayT